MSALPPPQAKRFTGISGIYKPLQIVVLFSRLIQLLNDVNQSNISKKRITKSVVNGKLELIVIEE